MEVKKRISADVVIMGAGNAGSIAAIEARNRGASVILLEKGPREKRGGNSRLSVATSGSRIAEQTDLLRLVAGPLCLRRN